MKGIIMTTESVRGTLDGRKCMTRRVLEPQPIEGENGYWHTIRKGHHYAVRAPFYPRQQDGTCMYPWGPEQFIARCAPCKVGDILYVKERVTILGADNGNSYSYFYEADGPMPEGRPWGRLYDTRDWWSARYMPRAAARIFLRVTEVRVERLQEISEEDAIAEGCLGVPCDHMGRYACEDCMNTGWREPPEVEFMELWDSINGTRKGGIYAWDKNPWIWVYMFGPISKEEAEREDAA